MATKSCNSIFFNNSQFSINVGAFPIHILLAKENFGNLPFLTLRLHGLQIYIYFLLNLRSLLYIKVNLLILGKYDVHFHIIGLEP